LAGFDEFSMAVNEANAVVTNFEVDAQEQSQVDSQFTAAATAPESDGGETITPQEAREGAEAGASGSAVPTIVEPDWILQVIGNRELTAAERTELVQNINIWYGKDFTTFEEVVESGVLDRQTQHAENIVLSSVASVEPIESFSVQLASGDLFAVTAQQFESAMGTYGLDAQGLTRMIRLTDTLGVRGADGKYLAWQPIVSLAKAAGLLNPYLANQSALDDAAATIDLLNGGAGSGTRTVGVDFRAPDEIDFMGAAPIIGAPSRGPARPGTADTMERAGGRQRRGTADTMERRGSLSNAVNAQGPGFYGLAALYQEGLKIYGDVGMAWVHSLDAQFAQRLKAAKGDPRKIDGFDRMKLYRMAANGGFQTIGEFSEAMTVQGYAEAQGSTNIVQGYLDTLLEIDALNERDRNLREAAEDPAERIRVRPDPVRVEQAVTDLWRQLFLKEPDAGQKAAFAAKLESMIANQGDEESIDVEGQLRAFAEGAPEYRELYGRKPAGMSELEYQEQFRSAQRTILGNEAGDEEAVRAGLRDGQYQTAVGAAAGTKQAWDNSTWLGRLASAAQVVSEQT
jgi:hypothetical protein